jgi:hypothetical protein
LLVRIVTIKLFRHKPSGGFFTVRASIRALSRSRSQAGACCAASGRRTRMTRYVSPNAVLGCARNDSRSDAE